MLAFDHVISVVDDLERASAGLRREHGLGSVEGGRHVDHGTGNRIVPLGDSYLELMAVVDEAEAAQSPLGVWVGQRLAAGGGLSALCLRTDEIDIVGERLGEQPAPMSRRRPDGVELVWQLAGLGDMVTRGDPFFIQWDIDADDHPGRTSASHDRPVGGIAWVEIGATEAALDARLGPHELDLRVVDGPEGPRRVGIAGPDHTLILG